ncbi:fimbrial protein [Serratia quinivorans]|uniref:fimbrial protein n=1 Tax=Serratia quinivorans TaxID=137545 RepID=UPI002177B080|nr:fimbrial protein [Serratia quinivorans]CAI1121415.1 Type-1A pilin [Serratia quinivorans]CAI1152897.1 Type-1A pilin [Serratia quinivorans]CAI1831036.1 Type-1A pilin [Serratia quinivorans]CAI2140119.1 Type-1A pilin [Serratia quinivorans]CAI2150126.1 Type-1A pilin [Serratia quinivorans]
MQRYLKIFIFFALSVTGRHSFAASCSVSSGGNWTTSGNLTYQRDQAIGTWGSKKFGSSGSYNFSCISDVSVDRIAYFTISTSANPVAGYTDVYPTNISGVGVRYNFAGGGLCPVKYDDHINNSELKYTCFLKAGSANNSIPLGASVEFVKISQAVASGMITTIPKVSATYSLNGEATVYALPVMWTGAVKVNLTSIACSISTSAVSVPLGDVLMTKFTSVGATAITKDFNVGLNCDTGAKVNVSLSGTANTDIANTDILALSSAGTAGVADGLGVQILYNDVPLKRDANLLLKTSAGGVETFPFIARYYQTKNVVKPGKADATATLNLTYQ